MLGVRARQRSPRVGQLERKARKLEREVGPLRFVAHTGPTGVLERVFALKSAQCRRTGTADVFAPGWTRSLARRLLAVSHDHFGGCLSALYAGERLLAAHLGLRSARVWHWWFPVYEPAFAAYSPGGILLLEVAREAARRGASALDLGKGDDPYKRSFADHEVALAEGCVTRPSAAALLRRLRQGSEAQLRASPIATPLRPLLRAANRWVRARRFD